MALDNLPAGGPDEDAWWDHILRRSRDAPRARESNDSMEPDEIVGLSVIHPEQWDGVPVPERRWIVPDLIPAETVTLFTANGGDGKSLLLMQLAAARSACRQWLGLDVASGRTLVVSAEDDGEEMHRRADGIRRHYRLSWPELSDMLLVDLVGQDAVLGEIDGLTRSKIVASRRYKELEAAIVQHAPDLVIVDALADAYAGNEIDRQQARQFIGLMRGLCRRYRLTVIVIAHPSVQGMSSGSGLSGSTAWSNSVRSRLYLSRPKEAAEDSDLRVLSTMKSNYGPIGAAMTLRYSNGAFVVVTGSVEEDRALRHEKADRVFLSLLRDHLDSGQNVSPSASASYAPKRFAEHPKAQGVTKKEFEAAMQRLLSEKRIAIETIGPRSRETKRLIVVGSA